MTVIMPLNTFANRCGYFFNHAYDHPSDPDVNNGYNCSHPEQDETGDCNGKEIGCCFASSCPLAYPANGLECGHFGIECDSLGKEQCDCENEYMVCEIPDDKFDEHYMYKVLTT